MAVLSRSMNVHLPTSGKQTLLYYVTNEESLNTIDKMNKVSLLFNNDNYKSDFLSTVETFNDEKLLTDDSSKSSAPKLYSLLYAQSDYMLIGTKSRLINISLSSINSMKNKFLFWPQSSANSKSKTKSDCLTSKSSSCQNYIRTAVPLNIYQDNELESTLIVCGTNSSQPFCRKYNVSSKADDDDDDYFTLSEEFQSPQFYLHNKMSKNNKFDSQNMIPAFSHNSESIYFVNPGSFTQEPSINKQVILKNSKFSSKLVKTPRGALKNANFRSYFEYNDKVYFFYSETDLADETNGLTFKTPYSLIGEVCADDNGRTSFSGDANRFITFKKSIIYCYLPDYKDEFYFKYTEIQAVSKPIKRSNSAMNENEDVFYAIFTFRRVNSIDSALCKYKVKTIENTMKGYFKSMEYHEDSITYRKPLDSCSKYKELKESTLNEYNKEMNKYYKFEMEQNVNEPALFALNNIKFTSLVVDQASWKNNFNDVIFIGTEDGRVIKLITREITIVSNKKKFQQPIILQEYQIFDNKPITNLIIYINDNYIKLVAISDEQIKSIHLDSFCDSYLSCAECVVSQDPYCIWSVSNSKCLPTSNHKNEPSISDPLNGDINKCYEMKSNGNESSLDLNVLYSIKTELQTESGSTTNQINFDSTVFRKLDSIVNKNSSNESSSNNLLIAIFLTALISSLASIIFTWLFIKKRYQMAEYVAKHLLQTSVSSSNQSNRSSTSSYNNYTGQKFQDTKSDQQKCTNYYEKPNKKAHKDLNGPRYITPDSPITSTTVTNMDSNQHSPNGNQLLTHSLNSALSSSDDSFEPPQINHNRRNLMFSANNSDIINITTNLLSRPDSNI